MKFCSSMTLFSLAAEEDKIVFRLALDRYCSGRLGRADGALLEGQAG